MVQVQDAEQLATLNDIDTQISAISSLVVSGGPGDLAATLHRVGGRGQPRRGGAGTWPPVLSAVQALPAAAAIAAAVFLVDLAGVQDAAPENSLCHGLPGRPAQRVAGTTWTIRKTDGTPAARPWPCGPRRADRGSHIKQRRRAEGGRQHAKPPASGHARLSFQSLIPNPQSLPSTFILKMTGLFDILRRNLFWWSSPVLAAGGPYATAAAAAAVAGAAAGDTATAGAARGTRRSPEPSVAQ